MPDSALDRFAAVMGRFVPDAITSCIGLMLVLATAALALGNSPFKIWDAYYQGLWMLLAFTMQMTLIITLSATLSSTPFFRRGVERLARLPGTRNQFIILAVLISGVSAYCYWGLGIAMAPVVAIYFAREAERRCIDLDFPFLLATAWGANALWQYGLSASAPLLVATPGHFLEKTIGIIPLSTTIWSPASLILEFSYLGAVLLAGCLLMPEKGRPISQFPGTAKLLEPAGEDKSGDLTYSERIERNRVFAWIMAACFAMWLIMHFVVRRASLDINSLNTTLLLLTFLLHGTVKRFTDALQQAVQSAWPVIVLYHLYAGVAGLIQFTTLGEQIAGLVARISTPLTFPGFTAAVGTIFAMFIPSSGGQWAIQGFVTVKAAQEVGVSVQRAILAMSVGDHMGNLASPFWYVVIAGIARVDFRSFFGYGLLFAAIWFVLGVVVFTFAPC
ncbi:MAG: short-chain fatty acid transporter [Bryobacterales bacterium]|nr:short-chain fatty acid transporter [Bryobacterales bacterium]